MLATGMLPVGAGRSAVSPRVLWRASLLQVTVMIPLLKERGASVGGSGSRQLCKCRSEGSSCSIVRAVDDLSRGLEAGYTIITVFVAFECAVLRRRFALAIEEQSHGTEPLDSVV